MSVRSRPNLFIIGAMKSGTTSLHAYLDQHPSIFMCWPKEPEHFGRWTIPYDGQDQRLKDEDEYLRLFEAAADVPIRGDASTAYTKLPHYINAVEEIAAFDPDARLIYIMRDPIARVISHYWHMVDHGVEKRGPQQAVEEALDGTDPRAPQYLSISHYAMQLEPYLERFDRSQLKTLTLEELRVDPVDVVRGLFAWLGVDPEFVPPNIGDRVHVTPKRVGDTWRPGLVRRFAHSAMWERLKPWTPRAVRWLGHRAYHGVRRPALGRSVDRATVSTDGAKQLLRPILQEQTVRLGHMLEREFPEWTTLHDTSR